MAKANEKFAEVASIVSIFWFKDLNGARLSGNYGSETELKAVRQSLTDQGWFLSAHGLVEAEVLTPELLERGMRERESFYTALKNAATMNPDALADVHVFEAMYCEDGKLIRPKIGYQGLTANRRGSQLFAANVARYKNKDGALPLIDKIPVQVYTFDSDPKIAESQRLAVQIGENEFGNIGRLQMSDLDYVLIAQRELGKGRKEADVQRMFGPGKRGAAQKATKYVELSCLWPELEMIDRLKLADNAERKINYKPLDKEVLRSLKERSRATTLAAYNTDKDRIGNPATLVTSDDVDAYLRNPSLGKPVKATVGMSADNITGISVNSPVNFVRKIAQGIITNNSDVFDPLTANATVLNLVGSVIEQGDGPILEGIVKAFFGLPAAKRMEIGKLVTETMIQESK